MDEKKIERFELDTISDRQTGVLCIRNKEETFALARDIIAENQCFEIQNDTQKRIAKETRARYNKVIGAIDRRRIDSVSDFTADFENDCNELKALFVEEEQKFKAEIKRYEDSQKLVVGQPVEGAKKFVATIKFTDEKLVKKLTDFCSKNGCELTIK